MGSWCGECILEAPSLNTLARSVTPEGIAVVGVAIDDHPQAAKALADRLKIPYPLLIDSARRLKTFFEIRGVPVTYLLGGDGTILEFIDPETGRLTHRVTGPRQWDSAAALRSVRDAALPKARAQNISNLR
jgi:peroxiredoxin